MICRETERNNSIFVNVVRNVLDIGYLDIERIETKCFSLKRKIWLKNLTADFNKESLQRLAQPA